MTEINWTVDENTQTLINQCVDRYASILLNLRREKLDKLVTSMDLVACHNHIVAMDFAALLKADQFNFLHDMGGIVGRITRADRAEDLKLRDCFLPRFMLKEPA